jgi:short subunit dehydrogenase-like uncharacterized protein
MTTDTNGTASSQPFDIVLFGATGFTGRLVAEYLVRRRASVRWALAGRSRDKLERIREELAAIDPAARDLAILVGDAQDLASVDAIVRGARVVCTTVGPYARYGSNLVAACAAHGVSYCDLTGETQWIRAMVDAHHGRAAETGARIVHCCGFDSIPSDLGVLLAHEHLKARGKQIAEARYSVRGMRGGVSGGTLASGIEAAEQQAKDPSLRRILADPYTLSRPLGVGRDKRAHDKLGPRKDPETGRWSGPFVMAFVNTRIVHRSNALLDFTYGRDFRYEEGVDTGTGPLGFVRAALVTAVTLGGIASLGVPPLRALAARFLPAPGEGPSREERENGFFKVEVRATSTDGEKVVVRVSANRDPGYGATAIMLSEAALCLAEDDLKTRGGVLTPASAMGMKLVERLRAAGMTLSAAP